mmetsp:Transcript_8248/g.16714  ORF Transcript_8248/g.16714 Transcript_8248/m.16714 type:complete len:98 (+) Transcript_8248:914-1207(+)
MKMKCYRERRKAVSSIVSPQGVSVNFLVFPSMQMLFNQVAADYVSFIFFRTNGSLFNESDACSIGASKTSATTLSMNPGFRAQYIPKKRFSPVGCSL